MTAREMVDRMIPVLVSAENAKRLRKDGVKVVRRLDFYVTVGIVDDHKVRLISSEAVEGLDLPFKTVLKCAIGNAAEHGLYWKGISEALGNMSSPGLDFVDVLKFDMDCFGASVLLAPKFVFGPIADVYGDLVVLPSSVHEVLVMRYDEDRVEELRNTVRQVNATLEPQDVLSGNVYVYRLGARNLEVL